MNRQRLGPLILVSLAIGATIYLMNSMPPASSIRVGGGNTAAQHPNYSLSQLKQGSTIIVHGVVMYQNMTYGYTANLPSDIVFQFSISSFIKGNGPNSIYVTDSGSSYNDPMVGTKGDATIGVGNSYVLFLSSDWTCLPSPPYAPCVLPPTPLNRTYHIVGGIEGKFLVRAGLVYSFSVLYPDADAGLGVDANGVSVSQFDSRVSSA